MVIFWYVDKSDSKCSLFSLLFLYFSIYCVNVVLNFVSESVKPLEGGPARKIAEQKLPENTSTVLHVSRIPHGFYEKEMEGAQIFFLVFY